MKKQDKLLRSSKRRSPGGRISSIALTLCMTLALLPTAAFATENTNTTAFLDFTNVGDGDGQTPATGAGYTWSEDAEGGSLELNGLSLHVAGTTFGNAIVLPQDKNVTVTVIGNNEITASMANEQPGASWNGIGRKSANDDDGTKLVKLQGDGTLTIHADGMAIVTGSSLDINGITLDASGDQGGVWSRLGSLTVTDANVAISSPGKSAGSLQAGKALTFTDSVLDIANEESTPIWAAGGALTISGSELTSSCDAVGAPPIWGAGVVDIKSGAKVTAIHTAAEQSYGIYAVGKLSLGNGVTVSTKVNTCGILLNEALTESDDTSGLKG